MGEKSKIIYKLKGLAILSVICAHCNSIVYEPTRFAAIGSLILQNIGTAGVVCFFAISGYLFHPGSRNKTDYFLGKMKRIGLPWLISGTLVYFYVYLRKPPITFFSWINFVLGNGSYCYYLTVAMMLYALFLFVPMLHRRGILLCLIAVTLVTVSAFRGMPKSTISPYLNLTNWIGYFAFGVYLRQYGKKLENFFQCHISLKVLLGMYVALLFFQVSHKSGGGYWGEVNALVSWTGAMLLTKLAFSQWIIIERIFAPIGQDSFFIYIWHMPFAGIAARLMSIGNFVDLMFLRPWIVLAIVECLCIAVRLILETCGMKKYAFTIGIN